MEFLKENTGTILTLLVIAFICLSVIYKMRKDKKKGVSPCGCNCENCGGACEFKRDK